MLQTDIGGGDTQFIDMFEAYDRLSPQMQAFCETLQVLNSSAQQAEAARLFGGVQRKTEIESIHPLVIYHPVVKRKALYVNKSFSTRILGLKQEESDLLLQFLIRHTETLLDGHLRANWDENTIVLWDNRRVIHTATVDWDTEALRHAFRLTTLGNRPVGSEAEFNDWTPEKELEELKHLDEKLQITPAEYYEKYGKKFAEYSKKK
ncbi:unnamed protein product [Ambrosiozyma monospora]|uniref:Unnamed protein product n=1 Tax=Ambrosiozyma monospora TaxID=43982 RepID=A0A9W6YNA8_AMBMO|nr:unnamed protein product [Ambrosiozyma monospora]